MLKLCQAAKQLKTASRCPLEISELEGKHWYKHSNSKNAPRHCTGLKWKVCECADCWMCPWFYEVNYVQARYTVQEVQLVIRCSDSPLFPSPAHPHCMQKCPETIYWTQKALWYPEPLMHHVSNVIVKRLCDYVTVALSELNKKKKKVLNLNRNTKCSWDKVFCFEGFYSLSKVLDKDKLCIEHGYVWTIKGSWKFIVFIVN